MWSPQDFESLWKTDRKKQRNCRPGSRPGTISPRYQEAPARSELAVQIITIWSIFEISMYILLTPKFELWPKCEPRESRLQSANHHAPSRCVICWKIFFLALPHGCCRKRKNHFTPTAVAYSRRCCTFSGESNGRLITASKPTILEHWPIPTTSRVRWMLIMLLVKSVQSKPNHQQTLTFAICCFHSDAGFWWNRGHWTQSEAEALLTG